MQFKQAIILSGLVLAFSKSVFGGLPALCEGLLEYACAQRDDCTRCEVISRIHRDVDGEGDILIKEFKKCITGRFTDEEEEEKRRECAKDYSSQSNRFS